MYRSLHRHGRLMTASMALVGLFLLGRADAATGSVVYFYDPLGRLSSANYDTGICITYNYDANGNRTSENIVVPLPSGVGYWNCFNWDTGKWN